MKKLFYLLCLAAFVSCTTVEEEFTPDPEIINSLADFEFTPDPTNAFKYTFKNLSKNFERVEWRFGDDTLTTVLDPTHIYKGTGAFDVELRTFSETGTVSKKMVKLNIVPDSILKITYASTGVANELKLGVEAKADVESVLWTFNEVSPAATATGLTPTRVFRPGHISAISAKITTKDGSVATVTKTNMSSHGFVNDATKEIKDFTVSAENNGNANEASKSLFDNNTETKFLLGGNANRAFTWPVVVTANFEKAETIKIYAIGNANDAAGRDPKEWTVQGSNDGVNWETLDSRVMAKNFYTQRFDLGFTADADRYKKLFYFGIANPKPFTKYRLTVTSNWGDALIQFSEWNLYK